MPFGSKGDISKKDMNFFSEFTAKAARTARMLFYAVIGIVAVLGVMFILVVAAFIRNATIKSDIKAIKKELNTETYQNLEAEYAVLQAQINEKTQYLYALGEMRNTIDNTNAAKVEITDILQDCIPNDAYVASYSLNGTSLSITGRAFSYYSVSEFANLLQQSNIFTTIPVMSVSHFNAEDAAFDVRTMTVNLIDSYYDFTVQGTLTSDIHITVKRFLEGVTTSAIGLTEIGTAPNGNYLVPGDEYTFDSVVTAQQGAETYNLSYILINGSRMADEEFQIVLDSDQISGVVDSDTIIELYYVAGGAN